MRLRFEVTADQLADRTLALAAAAHEPAVVFAGRLRLDDLYLATACVEGEDRAWTECQRAHFAFIRDFARRFLPDAAARDLADQVIADLWQRQKIGRYSGRSTLRTWLGTLVANAAINAGRSTRAFVPIEPDADEPRAFLSPAAVVDAARVESERALASIVADSVMALPADEKLLVQLYYEQGLTLDAMEIALRISKATLSRRLMGIRARLRTAIDETARRVLGTSADALREGMSLEHVELDLSELFHAPHGMKKQRGGAV